LPLDKRRGRLRWLRTRVRHCRRAPLLLITLPPTSVLLFRLLSTGWLRGPTRLTGPESLSADSQPCPGQRGVEFQRLICYGYAKGYCLTAGWQRLEGGVGCFPLAW
jgi:hypothetical protein